VIAEVLYQDVGVSNSKPIAFYKNLDVSPGTTPERTPLLFTDRKVILASLSLYSLFAKTRNARHETKTKTKLGVAALRGTERKRRCWHIATYVFLRIEIL